MRSQTLVCAVLSLSLVPVARAQMAQNRPFELLQRMANPADVDGDGADDFGGVTLTGGENIASRYAGKPAAETVLDTPSGGDWDIMSRTSPGGIKWLLDHLPEGIYRTEDMVEFFKMSGPRAETLLKRGKYVHKTFKYSFQEDEQGRIVYDPEGTGAPNQVMMVSGTSFASSFICGR